MHLLPRWTGGQVVVTGRRWALIEGSSVSAPALEPANGLVTVVPGGILVRTGVGDGTVSIHVKVLAGPPAEIDAVSSRKTLATTAGLARSWFWTLVVGTGTALLLAAAGMMTRARSHSIGLPFSHLLLLRMFLKTVQAICRALRTRLVISLEFLARSLSSHAPAVTEIAYFCANSGIASAPSDEA